MIVREQRTARRGRPLRERRAATLIELLVVIALISLLIAILVPSLRKSVEAASATLCRANIHEIHRSLVMYQTDNDGWLPTVVDPDRGVDGMRRPDTWFMKLYPMYMPDPMVLTCPEDPFKYRMLPSSHTFEKDIRPDYSSFGLSKFIMTAGDGRIADIERHMPARPGDTILLADMGPDHSGIGTRVAGVSGPVRNYGLLPWDDGFDPWSYMPMPSWLTRRHNDGVHVLTLSGGVRHARTSENMKSPPSDYYPKCESGGCVFCSQLRKSPHYTFVEENLYWWNGPIPSE